MEAVCFRHPGVQAVTSCLSCGKAICGECMVRSEGSTYCSRECAQKQKALGGRLHRELDRARGRAGLGRRFISYLIIAAVVWAILDFLDIIQFTNVL